MEKKICIVNYSEIKLKGKNRRFFEKKLRDNIWYALKKNEVDFSLHQEFGKIKIENFNSQNKNNISDILKDIPGISTFYFPIVLKEKKKIFSKKYWNSLKKKNLKLLL